MAPFPLASGAKADITAAAFDFARLTARVKLVPFPKPARSELFQRPLNPSLSHLTATANLSAPVKVGHLQIRSSPVQSSTNPIFPNSGQ
jgi:hypothetical protein